MKLFLAYWSSPWQAATSDEPVIDLIFGVITSRAKAESVVSKSMSKEEWEEYKDEFVYEEVEVDAYHPIPKMG